MRTLPGLLLVTIRVAIIVMTRCCHLKLVMFSVVYINKVRA